MKHPTLLLLALGVGISTAHAQPAPLSLDLWKTTTPPFSFKYDGRPSSQFLSTWQKTEDPATPSEGGETHHYTYTDPATKLKIAADVRTYADFPAIDWVLHFTNGGSADTSILEDIQALDWTFPAPPGNCILHHARGSNANVHDFEPLTETFGPGGACVIGSRGGRSSDTDTLPFFNLQMGAQGIIGAIGWTGNWSASFNDDKTAKTLTAAAGMQKTHFLLHPGETVRTPRIVLLDGNGGVTRSQNLWRRFVLAHYSPRDQQGNTVLPPLCLGTWGTALISSKLDVIKQFHDRQIPIDAYWVDAGWYGAETPKPGTTIDHNSPWWRHRGSWWPNKQSYPDGLKPLGDAVHAANMRFLLWVEPEEADPGSTIRVEHPGWFFTPPIFSNPGTALLNLGNPDARQGITRQISQLISDAGIDWYRQDFNVAPDRSWNAADTPDRVGISEINHITGLYQFWDDLRAQHPGLQIDNCASGGRRIDIETMSRSVPLWRSDYECNPFDPAGGQAETEGLAPWVPLNAGCFGGIVPGTANDGASLLYGLRSSYSSGFVFSLDYNLVFPIDRMKALGEEFHEVRPYFMGDFYPLSPYKSAADIASTLAMQFDRPDLKSGLVVLLRRQHDPHSAIPLALSAIAPQAQYDVEVRTGWEKAPIKTISGQTLAHLQVTIPDQPGSALIFYKQH